MYFHMSERDTSARTDFDGAGRVYLTTAGGEQYVIKLLQFIRALGHKAARYNDHIIVEGADELLLADLVDLWNDQSEDERATW